MASAPDPVPPAAGGSAAGDPATEGDTGDFSAPTTGAGSPAATEPHATHAASPPLPVPDPALRRRFLGHLIWLAAVGTAIDLATKSWADAYLHDPAAPDAGEWWPGAFVLRWALNDGALFGTMGGQNLWLLVLSIVAIPIIGYFFWTNPRQSWPPTLALAAILAGTFGNLYDRVVFRGVRDFIYFEKINYPIFNVADIWICCGAALFVIEVLRSGRAPAPAPPAASGA